MSKRQLAGLWVIKGILSTALLIARKNDLIIQDEIKDALNSVEVDQWAQS